MAAAVCLPSGKIISRAKIATPQKVKPRDVYDCVNTIIAEVIDEAKIQRAAIKGIGLGIPGIVDTRNNHILAAPNIALTGFPLASLLKRKYRTHVAMANDVNVGILGEAWLGAAKGLSHVVGLFPGTGVGGAVIADGHLLLGQQGAATELGHMIMQVNGPLCHCGNRGCLEALTSRWAIERDIRALVKAGKRSQIVKLNDGQLTVIKSRVIKEALYQKDPVVVAVMTQMAQNLGQAAVSLNHTFNPQAIILGGGVIKACGFFILPIVDKAIKSDPFFKQFNRCKLLSSALADDAVILGAVKLALRK